MEVGKTEVSDLKCQRSSSLARLESSRQYKMFCEDPQFCPWLTLYIIASISLCHLVGRVIESLEVWSWLIWFLKLQPRVTVLKTCEVFTSVKSVNAIKPCQVRVNNYRQCQSEMVRMNVKVSLSLRRVSDLLLSPAVHRTHTNSIISREEDLVKAQRACLTRLPGYICWRQSSSWESSL